MALLLATGGAACLAASFVPYDTVRAVLDGLSADGAADLYGPGNHRRLALILRGAALFLTAGTALWYTTFPFLAARKNEDGGEAPPIPPVTPLHLGALFAITVLTIAFRAIYRDAPMRTDEAFTYLIFASKPFLHAISDYTQPNNHIFHTILVKVSVALFGNEPWAIRLPAFLFGCTVPLWIFAVGRRLFTPSAGLIAAGLAAGAYNLAFFSVNGRGYVLVAVFFLAAVLATDAVFRRPGWTSGGALALAATLGLYTLPTMLHALAAIGLWRLILAAMKTPNAQRPAAWAVFFLALGAAGCATLLLYAPAFVRMPGDFYGQHWYLASKSWTTVLAGNGETLVELFRQWHMDQPVALTVFIVLGATGGMIPLVTRKAPGPALLVAGFAAAAILVLAQRVAPFSRVWLYLLPVYLLVAASAIADAIEKATATNPQAQRNFLLAATFLLALVSVVTLERSGRIVWTADTGGMSDAPAIVNDFGGQLGPKTILYAKDPAEFPLRYYLDKANLPPRQVLTSPYRSVDLFAHADTIYVVHCTIDANLQVTLDETWNSWDPFGPLEVAGEYDHATVYRATRKL